MDIRARFRLPARDYDERTCVVVVNVAENVMGLVVDHVNEVMDIPAAQVEPPPAANANGGGKYVKGIGKIGDEVKILLEVDCLLGLTQQDSRTEFRDGVCGLMEGDRWKVFKNLKINAKLGLAFTFMTIIITALGFSGYGNLVRASAFLTTASETHEALLNQLGQLQAGSAAGA